MSRPESGRRPRVVVTGIGVKSPAGNSLQDAYDTILSGKPTAAVVPHLAEVDAAVQFACTVPPFEVERHVSRRERRQIDRPTELALCAAAEAVEAADLPTGRIGVHLGTGIGGLSRMERVSLDWLGESGFIPVHSVTSIMANSAASRIAQRYGFRGSCTTYSTACSSGAVAIGEACRRIQYGELDAVVTGGFDAAVSPVVIGGFAQMRALSRRAGDPAGASRPFDAGRDGFVMGEGATVLVLERREAALARGATIHGEVLGYAANCDAHSIMAPRADGEAAAACMAAALADAGLGPRDIGHVNAHGTGTQLNDDAEATAIHRCFGGQAPPVTSVKGVTGHLVGGSGALEAAIALVCASRLTVPPVANLTTSTVADRIDVVAGTPRSVDRAPVLSTSFGFGGQNAALVLAPAT